MLQVERRDSNQRDLRKADSLLKPPCAYISDQQPSWRQYLTVLWTKYQLGPQPHDRILKPRKEDPGQGKEA